jgi:hypothetical protein
MKNREKRGKKKHYLDYIQFILKFIFVCLIDCFSLEYLNLF